MVEGTVVLLYFYAITTMPNEIFCSYSRRDSLFVAKLNSALARKGIDLWLDVEDLAKAKPWEQEVIAGIASASNFIYCISPDSVASNPCNLELNQALSLNKRLIPLLVQPTPIESIRPAVREFNWIDFPKEGFKKGVNQLLQVLDSHKSATFGSRLDAEIDLLVEGRTWVFSLFRHTYYLGRSPEASYAEGGLIKFEEPRTAKPTTSRKQATLARLGDRWHICDGEVLFNRDRQIISHKPSTNGFELDGTPFKDKNPVFLPLRNNSTVKFSAKVRIVYREIYSLGGNKAVDIRDTYTGQEQEG